MSFSLLMSVYAKDCSNDLDQCLASLQRQTLPADEVILVKDGPLGDALNQVILRYQELLPLNVVALPVNQGLGRALQVGLEHCRHELVARMDSDDVAVPNRFELQVEFFDRHPEIDVLGGAIAEFESDWRKPYAVRRLPESSELLARFARHRNPLNHVTVMFRRTAVIAAGSYQPCEGFEDYSLWARMLLAGSRLHNLPDVLVQVRCGNGMQSRRGGVRYVRQELYAQRKLLDLGFLTRLEFMRNVLVRSPLRLIPGALRARFYQMFLRERLSGA